jgi:hypothetical protein
VEDVIAQALAVGGAYNISDAITINGQPGAFYNCSIAGKCSQNPACELTKIPHLIHSFPLF